MTVTATVPTSVLLRRLAELDEARDRLNVEHARVCAVLEGRGALPTRRRRPVARHGTDGGYHRHQRTGDPACGPCIEAHRESCGAVPAYTGGRTWAEWREDVRARGVSPRRVRSWAQHAGLDVGRGSKLPAAVLIAWLEAHPLNVTDAA